MIVKIQTQIAVFTVQPLEIKIECISVVDIFSMNEADEYAISIMGITVSFAAIPKINAISITPSSPKRVPKGFKKSVHILSNGEPQTLILAKHHIIIPQGIDARIARKSTKIVLSKNERTRTSFMFGNLYDGSSSV